MSLANTQSYLGDIAVKGKKTNDISNVKKSLYAYCIVLLNKGQSASITIVNKSTIKPATVITIKLINLIPVSSL
jgi:hypothetical protein